MGRLPILHITPHHNGGQAMPTVAPDLHLPHHPLYPALMHPNRPLGLILVFASVIGWSMAGLFTRLLPLDAPTLLFWRGLFGAIGTLALIPLMPGPHLGHSHLGRSRLDRVRLGSFRQLGWPGLIYAAITAASMLLFIGALMITSVAHVAVITALVPLFAAALAWLAFRERPGPPAIIASIIALFGVIIMVGAGRDGSALGDLMAIGMAILMAAIILIARSRPRLPAFAAMTVASALSAAATLPFATLTGLTAAQLGLLALFAIVTQVIGFGLFALGARHLAPTETALLTTLEAPLAPFWVWLFLATAPTAPTLLGGIIVLAAVIFYLVRQSPPSPP